MSPKNPPALLALAERCEKAEGPDRELDCKLAESAGWTDVWHRNGMAEGWAPSGKCEAGIPRYTASLDEALTLVPEGGMWSVARMEEGPVATMLWPRPDGAYLGNYLVAHAATPALALCAAALRARAS